MSLSLPPSSRRYQSTPATARIRRWVEVLLRRPRRELRRDGSAESLSLRFTPGVASGPPLDRQVAGVDCATQAALAGLIGFLRGFFVGLFAGFFIRRVRRGGARRGALGPPGERPEGF